MRWFLIFLYVGVASIAGSSLIPTYFPSADAYVLLLFTLLLVFSQQPRESIRKLLFYIVMPSIIVTALVAHVWWIMWMNYRLSAPPRYLTTFFENFMSLGGETSYDVVYSEMYIISFLLTISITYFVVHFKPRSREKTNLQFSFATKIYNPRKFASYL